MYKRSFWTESFVQWSPHGSYLATMHRQGIALWGGPSFSRLHRFSHPNVRCPVRGCEGFAGFQGLGLLSAPSRPHMHRQGIALWGGPLLQPPAPLLAPQRALPLAQL